jgi:hypothetical protein
VWRRTVKCLSPAAAITHTIAIVLYSRRALSLPEIPIRLRPSGVPSPACQPEAQVMVVVMMTAIFGGGGDFVGRVLAAPVLPPPSGGDHLWGAV